MIKRFLIAVLTGAALCLPACAQRVVKQSTAYNALVFLADSADRNTGKTGLTLTITASKDGAAFASITPTVTELAYGWYKLALTTSHTDTVGDLGLHVTGTGADPCDVVLQVRANVLGDTLPSNVTQFGGNAGTFASGRPEVNTTHVAGTAQTAGDLVAYAKASRTIWVAASGGSASGPGTFDAPYNTFANAQTAANPGDTIHLKAGTYAAITVSKNGVTVEGDGQISTKISSSDVAAANAVTVSGENVTLRKLWIEQLNVERNGIYCANVIGLTIEDCDIDGAYDGVYAVSSVGLRMRRCQVYAIYDGFTVVSAKNFLAEQSEIVVDGLYDSVGSGSPLTLSYHGVKGDQGSTGALVDCTVLNTRSGACSGETIGVSSGHTIGTSYSSIRIINTPITVKVTNASATGGAYGLKPRNADSTEATLADIQGGEILVSNAGSGGAIPIAASVTGSFVRIAGCKYTATACTGTSNIEEVPWSTTPGRSLDITATGEAGIDWANVGSPTTSVNLSGTTVSTSQQVASVSGAVGSVTGAVGSVTGNVGGNVAGSVGSVSSATSIATALLATTNGSTTVGTQLQAAGTGGGTGGSFTETERAQILASLSLDADIGVPAAQTWVIKRIDGKMKAVAAIPKDTAEEIKVAADFRNVLAPGDAIAPTDGIEGIDLIDDGNTGEVDSTAFDDVANAEIWMSSAVKFTITGGTAGQTDRIRVKVRTVGGQLLSAPCSVSVKDGDN